MVQANYFLHIIKYIRLYTVYLYNFNKVFLCSTVYSPFIFFVKYFKYSSAHINIFKFLVLTITTKWVIVLFESSSHNLIIFLTLVLCFINLWLISHFNPLKFVKLNNMRFYWIKRYLVCKFLLWTKIFSVRDTWEPGGTLQFIKLFLYIFMAYGYVTTDKLSATHSVRVGTLQVQ